MEEDNNCACVRSLYVVDRVWRALFYLFLAWLLFSHFETAHHLLDESSRYLKNVPMFRSFVAVRDV